MIVGTAGHVDHGKTALIRALTGTDTDRLPEEKRRGISIDLGFAYLPLDSGAVLGFVDVPGHERFIRNMLAGAGAIDFALLAVAADDGVMPQTLEHLAILDLLGVSRGIVALTKCDLVGEDRLAEVSKKIRALLEPTGLAGCEVVAVSSLNGTGMTELRRALERGAIRPPISDGRGNFRMAVDRCFSLPGAGTVVTGTVAAGRVRAGDELLVSPAGLEARVRALRSQNRPADAAVPGQRCALNLIGRRIDTTSIGRGDWIVAPRAHLPTARLDAEIRMLPTEARALRQWSPVHVHHGTGFSVGRVAILEGNVIAPGARGFVQLVLDRPVPALNGDRFILRDVSAQRTVGGGRVLDPFAFEECRRSPRRLERLRVLLESDPERALRAALASGPVGLEFEKFVRARNLTATDAQVLGREVPHVRVPVGNREFAFDEQRWYSLCETVIAAVASGSNDVRQIVTKLRMAVDDLATVRSALDSLVAQNRLLRSESRFDLPRREQEADADSELRADLIERLRASGIAPPKFGELAGSLAADAKRVRRILLSLAARGSVTRVNEERYYWTPALEALAERVRILLTDAPTGSLSTSRLREGLSLGRNLAVEVLEYFDRRGLTERVAEGRRLRQIAKQRKGLVPGGASGLQIRKGPSAVPGGFDSHSLPPPNEPVG